MPTTSPTITTTTTGDVVFDIWPTEHPVFDADSPDGIEYLVPIVGPTAVIILHHVCRRLRQTPMTYYTTLPKLSHACGGGTGSGGRCGLIERGLARLVMFGFARQVFAGHYVVRTKVPALPARQIAHLPLELQHRIPVT
ncbi:hypothetical protein BH24ACT5_BH24ACT5_01510 [soil metagenome]